MGDFQEADVLWPENLHATCYYKPSSARQLHQRNGSTGSRAESKEEARPIDIPRGAGSCNSRSSTTWEMDFGCGGGAFGRYGVDADDDDDDEAQTVPPHVIIARRFSGKMAFSVCTGHGRTLKGRDLSQVRNSVLRLTGFLEG